MFGYVRYCSLACFIASCSTCKQFGLLYLCRLSYALVAGCKSRMFDLRGRVGVIKALVAANTQLI